VICRVGIRCVRIGLDGKAHIDPGLDSAQGKATCARK
jgi:hypothetical protein